MNHFFTTYKWLLLIMLATVALRMPNLNRPLSKHHEFNTAVVLTNALSWQQAGGAAPFGFTPLMNFQGPANKLLEKGPHTDSLGNHVYLSFGAGWYVLPYCLFSMFHIPFTPLALQWLNILISLLTIVLLYRLLVRVTGQHHIALAATSLFACMPATLWYGGNGYVTTSIMLPLVIAVLGYWHGYATQAHVHFRSLAGLAVSGIALCYFDWVAVFLLGGMAFWAAIKSFNQRQFILLTLVCTGTVVVAVWLILAQFAGYLGWQQVLQYWTGRFAERSTDTSQAPGIVLWWRLMLNQVTSFGPLLLVLAARLKMSKAVYPKMPYWLMAAAASVVLYNLVFFNWSALHEFAWMAAGLVATLLLAVEILPNFSPRRLRAVTTAACLASVALYNFINLPGPTNWKGERYDTYLIDGTTIAQQVPPDAFIFTTADNQKITEYYARRTFQVVASREAALKLIAHHQVKKAVWLQYGPAGITTIEPLAP
jgi:hypothetical protein